MSTPFGTSPASPQSAALQTVGLVFNAAGLAAEQFQPPTNASIQRQSGISPGFTVLDAIVLDASLEEAHTAQTEVTEHPVERGADVSDHVRPKPVEVRLTGLVSNSPIDPNLLLAAARLSPFGVGFVNAADTVAGVMRGNSVSRSAFDKLRQIRDNGTPVTIHTSLRDYPSMVMTELVVNQNAKVGDALQFSACFREIVVAETSTVSLKPVAQAALPMGAQPTAEAGLGVKKGVEDSALLTLFKKSGLIKGGN